MAHVLSFKYSRRKGMMVGWMLHGHRKAWDQEPEDLPKVPVPMLLLIHWVTWTKHCLSLDLPCQEKGLNWRISNIFSSFLILIITKQESRCYRGIQGLSTSCPWTSVVQIPLFSPAPQCASTILTTSRFLSVMSSHCHPFAQALHCPECPILPLCA